MIYTSKDTVIYVLFPIPGNFGSDRAWVGVTYDVIFSVTTGLQKVYPSFFLMCHMVYFNNMKLAVTRENHGCVLLCKINYVYCCLVSTNK